jgi:hypothetical protein
MKPGLNVGKWESNSGNVICRAVEQRARTTNGLAVTFRQGPEALPRGQAGGQLEPGLIYL